MGASLEQAAKGTFEPARMPSPEGQCFTTPRRASVLYHSSTSRAGALNLAEHASTSENACPPDPETKARWTYTTPRHLSPTQRGHSRNDQ